jgi:4-hydroxy-tetrahydrodipicolinate reductase
MRRMPSPAEHRAENARSTPSARDRDLRLLVHGAMGRMGQRIIACAGQEPGHHVVLALDRDGECALRPGEIDAIVDFSSDEGAVRASALAAQLGAALLVGTTGLSAATRDSIARNAVGVPAMIAPNTSLGVAVTRRLVEEAARLLPGFDIDIVETHHTRKLDAPSGTARSLAEAVGRGLQKPLDSSRIHAIRAGDVVGDHEVVFSGAGERVTIAHRATSRDLFALGALRMARWLAGQAPGMHTADEWFADFARTGA